MGKLLELEKPVIHLVMDDVDIMIGASTEIIAGEGMIVNGWRD